MQAKMIKPDIYDVDGLIDARFGKEGTPERAEAEERAYITRIENGQIEPKVSTFYRIAATLGCYVGLIFPA